MLGDIPTALWLSMAAAMLAPTVAAIVTAILARRNASTLNSLREAQTASQNDLTAQLHAIHESVNGGLTDAKAKIAELEERLANRPDESATG